MCSSHAETGDAFAIFGKNVLATFSNASPTRHIRGAAGFTFEKTRMIRNPRSGREGNASTCNRVSSLRHEVARPAISAGRKLVNPGDNFPQYSGHSASSSADVRSK